MKRLLPILMAAILCLGIFALPAFGAEKTSSALPNDLYVTDGLTLFLCGMPGYEDTLRTTAAGATWTDLFSQSVTLTGDKWDTDRGVGYRLLHSEYRANEKNEIVLDAFLPAGSYTVETVTSPVGLTNPDGSRYRDLGTAYGVTQDMAFVIGPFKSLSGVSLREEGVTNHALEHRWYYYGMGGWHASGCLPRIIDLAMATKNKSDVITYTVSHTAATGGRDGQYRIFKDGELTGKWSIPASQYISAAASEGYFRLFSNFPADIFAIRVYDRELTAAEKNQNRTADLFAFYGLDAAWVRDALSVTDRDALLFEEAAKIGFDLPKEEAEERLRRIFQGSFLMSLGLAARLDNQVGLRGAWEMNEGAVALMERDGAFVEISARVSLEGEDVILPIYDTENGKNEAFFLGDNVFGVTVRVKNGGAAEYILPISFVGCLRAVDSEGNVIHDMEIPLVSANYPSSVFGVYRHLSLGDYAENRFVQKTVNDSYSEEIFAVSPEGDDQTADGTPDAPFATVKAAYDALLSYMATADDTYPTEFVLYLTKGEHRISSPLQFTDENYRNGLFRMTVKGEGWDTVLTGNREISGEDFVWVDGEDYCAYQFEPDENGNYPDFRLLYVNGELATLATAGINRAKDGNQYITAFPKDHNNPGASKPKMYLDASRFEGVTAEDFRTMELHLQGQWCFNILRVSHVDFSDRAKNGALVAVYMETPDYQSIADPSGTSQNRPYWLENCLAFLDEEDEYFYDGTTGTLYYYPPEGFSPEDLRFEYPTVENLITVKGMEEFSLRDLRLTGVDDHSSVNPSHFYIGGQAGGSAAPRAAFVAENCSHLTVEGCAVYAVAGDGVHLRGRLRGVRICDNFFYEIGASALRLGNFSVAEFTEEHSIKDLLVDNNAIDGAAWLRRESCAIMLSQAHGASIQYNTIRNCSYSAISVGTHRGPCPDSFVGEVFNNKNVKVTSNYITDFMTDMRDGGAIYTLGGNAPDGVREYFNEIGYNLIVWSDISGDIQGKAHTTGLYNDNASSNYIDYGNVQIVNPERHWRGMYYHYVQVDGVHDILIEDNYYAGIPYTLPSGFGSERDLIYFNINNAKRIWERGTVYCNDPWDLPEEAMDIMYMAGSDMDPPDVESILYDYCPEY